MMSLIYQGGEKVTSAEFEKIYQTYFNYVYMFIRSLSRNTQLAEEITSETFFRAIKSIDSFRGDCDIQVWLCQIAKNCYYSYLRKHSRLDTTGKLPEQTKDYDIEELFFSTDASMKIHRILHEMEEPYKEVFSLRIFGELSFRQIASVFDKTENWACVTYHRAKKRIQDRMEDYL